MNSFIATAASNPPGNASETIRNDGFFPDICLNELRASARLDGTVTHMRLREATLDAIDSINAELASWRARQVAAGYRTLAEVPANKVDDQSVQFIRYRRAVFNLAHADLSERYRDWDTTQAGSHRAEAIESTICHARRNVRWAINDLLGSARATVELI